MSETILIIWFCFIIIGSLADAIGKVHDRSLPKTIWLLGIGVAFPVAFIGQLYTAYTIWSLASLGVGAISGRLGTKKDA